MIYMYMDSPHKYKVAKAQRSILIHVCINIHTYVHTYTHMYIYVYMLAYYGMQQDL
jgi:hypothetical protein